MTSTETHIQLAFVVVTFWCCRNWDFDLVSMETNSKPTTNQWPAITNARLYWQSLQYEISPCELARNCLVIRTVGWLVCFGESILRECVWNCFRNIFLTECLMVLRVCSGDHSGTMTLKVVWVTDCFVKHNVLSPKVMELPNANMVLEYVCSRHYEPVCKFSY